ncbi:MAG: type transport system permease protein [Pseudonocardiales bacterium]|nr:type transport system permease protein [Pseudonocardiales bacterium]
MKPRLLLATALRVLTQLRHDPRTVVLMVVVPSLLMLILRYVFDSERMFDRIGPALLGFFPFLLMFLVTSITMLRERVSGTLERLLTTPISRLDLVGGYAAAFAAVAAVQVAIATVVSLALGLTIAGSIGWLVLIALLNSLLGVALGLLASAFARTEFQAIQFMPLVVLPQLLLCGLLNPRSQMPAVLQWASDAMPLSYAVGAIEQVAGNPSVDGGYWRDALVVLGCVGAGLGLAAVTLRRRTD